MVLVPNRHLQFQDAESPHFITHPSQICVSPDVEMTWLGEVNIALKNSSMSPPCDDCVFAQHLSPTRQRFWCLSPVPPTRQQPTPLLWLALGCSIQFQPTIPLSSIWAPLWFPQNLFRFDFVSGVCGAKDNICSDRCRRRPCHRPTKRRGAPASPAVRRHRGKPLRPAGNRETIAGFVG